MGSSCLKCVLFPFQSHLIIVVNGLQGYKRGLPDPLKKRESDFEGRLITYHGDCDLTEGNHVQRHILSIVKETGVETKSKLTCSDFQLSKKM